MGGGGDGGGKGGGGGGTEVSSANPPWMDKLGESSAGKFQEWMGKQEGYSPYPEMKNPYEGYKSLFGDTGAGYLESFSAAPKAAYEQSLSDTKNMFGAKGTYGSVGNDMMTGAMANAGSKYATSMADAQQKAQNAQAFDFFNSAKGQEWANQNKLDALNYQNTMTQQVIGNYLASMEITIPAISQGQVVEQDSGGGGKGGGIGSAIGGAGAIAGMFCAKNLKEEKSPAEAVLAKVKTLPVERWRYKIAADIDRDSHIGPYAEDWAERFGGTGKSISYIDAIGVLLKAVQELAAEVETLKERKAA